MFSHDDDDAPSTSSAEYFNRADHGKQDQLEGKASAKGKLLRLKRAALKGQVDKKSLQNLQQQIEQQDQKRDQEHEKLDPLKQAREAASNFSPKTNAQEAKAAIQTALQQQSPDQLVQEAARAEATKQASDEEYQQDAG